MSASLLDTLRSVVGAAHVLTDGDLSAWQHDWRKRWHGKALAVVRPGSTEEVAAVVRACAGRGVAIVPQGGNTGLVGGGVPDASGTQVLLSLSRLNRIRELDRANLTLVAEAGCVLQAVQEAADAAGLLFPLSLAAEGSCTIGGNLATNAGGTQVVRYGNARALCLGLEVVTATGEVWHGLSGLRKDNTGYDLRDLFVGSEGTLGVITAATLALHPRPAAEMTALASADSLEACVALLGLAHERLGPGLTGFEVMNAFSLALVARHMPQLRQPLAAAPWTVLVELSDSEGEAHARERFEGLLGDALERGLIADAAVAETLAQSHTMWHLRESIPLAQAEEGLNIKHDIALPVSRIPAFCASTGAALTRAVPGMRLVNFGHLGDGNLHYNVQAPEGGDAATFLSEREHEINGIVYDAVRAHGGSISAEHGIGVLKRDELPQYKDATALALMRAVKRALDPRNLLNPGRVL
ncbi:MAG TPA: FAD-binding oxidoreductase [Burkholderiaceae bacterium]|nr:FAD-binding oxidoreductase [Burkholderiaceae bacterium]